MSDIDWQKRHDGAADRLWYAVVNDLIGGWAVSTINKPLSSFSALEDEGGYIVADEMTEKHARYIAGLHNEWQGFIKCPNL